MKNTQDNQARITRGRIRMAYSLNGTQPVLCTLLCDQPLYYMEEEIFEEEEHSLLYEEEKAINAALGPDFAGIQRKINIYDGIAKKYERGIEARLHDFIDNAVSFGAGAPDGAARLEGTLAALSQSLYTQSLLDYARALGTDIVVSTQVKSTVYDAHAHIILFNPDQMPGDAQLSLVAALRTLAQINNGAGDHPLHFHPDEAVLVNRAQIADLAVTQVRAAWELQLAGVTDAWASLEQGQGADLARAFAREALSDFRTLNNGKAAQAAFESWFLSDRCKIEDRELIQGMLTDQVEHVFGENGKMLDAAFLSALGEQTLGKNYLAGMSGLILTDPVFSDVRDRSNANFLWFVKFERSFGAAERALQGSDLPASDLLDADADGASVHHFVPAAFSAPAPLESAGASSNIVYVSFERG